MKIIVEQNIPFFDGLFTKYATVERLPSDAIDRAAVADADALVVRTRTRCDRSLLQGSAVRFIGTATIGTDHIDADYCRYAGITVANAPGCNAPAVAQWVMASVGGWLRYRGLPAHGRGLAMGIVGVGHVGSIVERWARQLGFNVLVSDPPKGIHTPLSQLARECDIITFHTPLTRDGLYPTFHMCDNEIVSLLNGNGSAGKLIMNAARGGVTDTRALLGFNGDLAIDCWEGEPDLNRDLLARAFVATPHIAGYSLEGKRRASAMIATELARYFGVSETVEMPRASITGAEHVTFEKIMSSYDPATDTLNLKNHPEKFEFLRNHYSHRAEVR